MISKGLIGNWQPLNRTAVTDMTVADIKVNDIIISNIVLNSVTDMMPTNEKEKKIIFCSAN